MIDNNGYNVISKNNGKENVKDNGGRGRTASFAGEVAKRRKGGYTGISTNNMNCSLATGGGDALVNIWDLEEMVSTQVISRLEHLVSNVGFSFDGRFIAAGGNDKVLDVSRVDSNCPTGKEEKSKLISIETGGKTESLAWHPSEHLLAFATIPVRGKMKYDYNNRLIQENSPTVRIFVLEAGGKKK